MNKRKVDKMIISAYQKLSDKKELFIQGKRLPKECQSRLAAFGAAIATGSLVMAISNYVDKSDRKDAKDGHGKEICEIIWSLMQENNKDLKGETLLDCVIHLQEEQESLHEFKEELKDAAVAVKLAMNFFELVKVD